MKGKGIKGFGLLGGLVVLGVAVVALLISGVGSSGKNLDEQLDLGAKYLSSLEYEQAIAAYETAVQIDPECVDAYLGLADAYEAVGEPVMAAQTMVFAYVNVAERDRAIVETTFNDLAGNYEEVQTLVNSGSLILGTEVSDEEFDSFFHVNGNSASGDQQGNENGNGMELVGDIMNLVGMGMDGEIDLNLEQFTLLGRPLGDWTFDSLESFIRSNFMMYPEYDDNGAVISTDRLYQYYSEEISCMAIIEYGQEYNGQEMLPSIQLDIDGVHYSISKNGYKSWSIQSYSYDDGVGSDPAKSICGKSFEEYLEALCPGLYAEIQTKDKFSLKNGGFVYKDKYGVQLVTPEGSLLLYERDGIITSFGVDFNDDYWVVTTDESQAILGESQATDVRGGCSVNWEPYTLFGQALGNWTCESIMEYIEQNYEQTFADELMEYYDIKANGESIGEIIISKHAETEKNIDFWFNSGMGVAMYFSETSASFNFSNYEGADVEGVDLGASEIMSMFQYTPMEYLAFAQPEVHNKLLESNSIETANLYVSLAEDGSVYIDEMDGRSIGLQADYETGRIVNAGFYWSIY